MYFRLDIFELKTRVFSYLQVENWTRQVTPWRGWVILYHRAYSKVGLNIDIMESGKDAMETDLEETDLEGIRTNYRQVFKENI